MKNTDNSSPSAEHLQREIDILVELMLPERVNTFKNILDNRTKYITVCLENIFHGQNASAILRSCEAFGIQNVNIIETICGFKPNVDIVKGTDKWLSIKSYSQPNATEVLVKQLKSEGYRIVSTSPHKDGKSCEDFDITKGKIALFFGTEKTGISEELTALSDEFVTIPMYGFVESLNVSVCSAISLQSFTKKLHDSNIHWQLAPSEKLEILNRWVKSSVKDSERILKIKLK